MMKSYEDLEIYQLAFKYFLEVHKESLKLPKYELYEQGSQLRRSSESVKSNIVEGYGRRRYKKDFIKFLIIAHASLLECKSQLKSIYLIHDKKEFNDLYSKYDKLGAKIYSFIQYVEKNWKT